MAESYTTNTLSHDSAAKTNGEREKYYAEGTHPPIIAKETFEQVQKLILLRKDIFGKKKEHPYPLSPKLICENCGTAFRRKQQRKHAYWCCMKHDTSLADCAMLPIAEESIYDAFCRLYYKLKHQSNSIFEQMLVSLQAIRNQRMLWSPDIVSLNKKISELSIRIRRWPFLSNRASLILTFLYPKPTS